MKRVRVVVIVEVPDSVSEKSLEKKVVDALAEGDPKVEHVRKLVLKQA